MNRSELMGYGMLCRVQEFLSTYAARLGHIAESPAAQEVGVLAAGIREGDQDALTTRAMKTGEAANRRVLRRALWVNHMQQLAAVARAELRQVPKFESLLLPQVNMATPKLVQWARTMAAVANEHAEVFVTHGLPAEFVAQLLAAADALEASFQTQVVNGRETAGARAQVASSRSRAQYVIRVLNAQIEKALVDDPSLLAQWRHAKRVGVRGAQVGAEEQVSPPAGQTATVQSAGTGALAGTASTNTGTRPEGAEVVPLLVQGPRVAGCTGTGTRPAGGKVVPVLVRGPRVGKLYQYWYEARGWGGCTSTGTRPAGGEGPPARRVIACP